MKFYITKGNKGRPNKYDLEENAKRLDPKKSNLAGENDPMTHSTLLYYQRKLEREERFKKIIG